MSTQYPTISKYDQRRWLIPYAIHSIEDDDPDTGLPVIRYGWQDAYHFGRQRPSLLHIQAAIVSAIRAEAERLITAKYPWWVQANIADGTYPAELKEMMLDYKAEIISAENDAYDAVQTADTAKKAMEVIPQWPEA